MGDEQYQRALYDAEFELYKRRISRYRPSEPSLKIAPVPMTLMGYIDAKMSDPLWFYGTIIASSVISGAIVALLLQP